MKNFDSRVYSVNDFVEWDKQGQVKLNPFFQRRPVWSEKAKSYLIDTILRGKPIPKIFARQTINITTKQSVREIVDGQQRLRTILSFVDDGFQVSRRHNKEFGGIFFSQMPAEVQTQVLSYELAVDVLVNMPDAEVLDIFSRLNSYAVVLNEQEKINATHFGPFKVLADDIGRKYLEFWTRQGILSSRNILRMQEVNLVADLLIALREGIKSKKRIKSFYAAYEKHFDDDVVALEAKFDGTMNCVSALFKEGLSDTEFRRVHIFYSLFTAVAHCLYEIPGQEGPRSNLQDAGAIGLARNKLDRVSGIFAFNDDLSDAERQFIQDSRRATTDEVVRKRRTKFLLELMAA